MGFSIRVRVSVRWGFSIRVRVSVRLGFNIRVRIRVQIWKYLSPHTSFATSQLVKLGLGLVWGLLLG